MRAMFSKWWVKRTMPYLVKSRIIFQTSKASTHGFGTVKNVMLSLIEINSFITLIHKSLRKWPENVFKRKFKYSLKFSTLTRC